MSISTPHATCLDSDKTIEYIDPKNGDFSNRFGIHPNVTAVAVSVYPYVGNLWTDAIVGVNLYLPPFCAKTAGIWTFIQ